MILRRIPILVLLLTFWAAALSQEPVATPSPAKAEAPPQTVSYLRSRISMILSNPELRRGQVGVKIVSAQTGATVYEKNPGNYFVPASNMKSFTVAAALERLSPGYRFRTSVYARSKPDPNGTLPGDLIVYGRGDPSFSSSFSEGAPYARLDELASAIVDAGIKTVSGSLVGDESYFKSGPIPYGWEWDDLQWYYGAEISALTAFDNSIELKVSPGSPGLPCFVQITPFNGVVRIVNKTRTAAGGGTRKLRVTKLLGQNVIEISGTMPEGDSGFRGRIAVSNPAELFADVLAQRLRQKGVEIKGGTRSIDFEQREGNTFPGNDFVEIAHTMSPPLSLIAPKTMKQSQNLYTELILRALGENTRGEGDVEATSDKKGVDAVQALLLKAGIEPRSVIQYDGSGLSRHNLITPDSAVKLFLYMDRSPVAAAWRNSLTIGGVDGTLERRFKVSAAEGNVRGKTGTLDQVSALSGYVTSKSGERFVFSVLTNYIPNSRLRTSTIDQIVVLLADFNGTSRPEPCSPASANC